MSCWEIILIALSLSIDTLAVSVSSSMTLKDAKITKIFGVAFAFGMIQTILLLVGWLCGASVLSYIYDLAGIIGFLMLLYIGGSMIVGALRKSEEEVTRLTGFKSVVFAGVATSIDAAAVGVSFAMTEISLSDLNLSVVLVFAITILAALIGIYCGSRIGKKFGKPAQLVGGIVLLIIGLRILLA